MGKVAIVSCWVLCFAGCQGPQLTGGSPRAAPPTSIAYARGAVGGWTTPPPPGGGSASAPATARVAPEPRSVPAFRVPPAAAVPSRAPAARPRPAPCPPRTDPYVEGTICASEPGTLTTQGPSGMFLNPTSGILPCGRGTVQICVASLQTANVPRFGTPPFGAQTVTGWGGLVSYGVTSWLEIGAILSYVDNSGESVHAGPMLRLRLFPERRTTPEMSVGFYSIEGGDAFQRRTAFAAASKRFASPVATSVLRGIRLHAGVRNTWRLDFEESDVVGYGGIELALPRNLFLVGELSSEDYGLNGAGNGTVPLRHTPWAAGVQMRTRNLAISVAAIQPGFSNDIGFFIGVGARDG